MRRRALLSGLLIGGIAVLSGALTVVPALEMPLEPDDGDEELQPPGGEAPLEPPSPEPHTPPPLPPGPEDDDEEEKPPTEPA